MKIENNTVVSLRYQMKNGKGEVLENNLAGQPVDYVHGATDMPAFAAQLGGFQPGNVTSLTLLKSQNPELLDDDFTFDVVIDDVRPATLEEIAAGKPASAPVETQPDCGPGCKC